jgi:hypothetical protein
MKTPEISVSGAQHLAANERRMGARFERFFN